MFGKEGNALAKQSPCSSTVTSAWMQTPLAEAWNRGRQLTVSHQRIPGSAQDGVGRHDGLPLDPAATIGVALSLQQTAASVPFYASPYTGEEWTCLHIS